MPSMSIASKFSAMSTTMTILGLLLFSLSISMINHLILPASELCTTQSTWVSRQQADNEEPPTNISHIVFGLVGSVKAWKHRKPYIESWWRPNITRGYIFLDTAPTEDFLPWSPSSPPYRISDDISNLIKESKQVAPIQVRIDHAIPELVREENEGVRWYVMGDDDSMFFVDNIVDVLANYDHTKYIYIGGHSECIASNFHFSFNKGFGGAGLILSYPLAKLVAMKLEDCIFRYPYLNSADHILMTCISDLGVSLTPQKGIHRIDLHGDISGFLSSHPQAPLLSLHHFDKINPIFPSMKRAQSAYHLMKAAKVDQSRIVQQTICYHKPRHWSFSISWGYSVHIYEKVMPRSILHKPLETFRPWSTKEKPPFYIFNTRPWPPKDLCEAPHIFFFESVEKTSGNEIVTSYARASSRDLPACLSSGNHSANYISKIQVFSPGTKLVNKGKSDCCDIVDIGVNDVVKVKYRDCIADEIIA